MQRQTERGERGAFERSSVKREEATGGFIKGGGGG